MSSSFNISRLKPASLHHIIFKALVSKDMDSLDTEYLAIYNRWQQVNDLIRRRMLDDKQVAAYLQQAYGVKRSQAYVDIAEAKAFFAISKLDDREYKRGTYIEWLEEAAKQAFAAGDLKVFRDLIKEASELQHMKTILPDKPRWEDIQPYQPTIVYDPTLISALAASANKDDLRKKYFAHRHKLKEIDDVEFEEINGKDPL